MGSEEEHRHADDRRFFEGPASLSASASPSASTMWRRQRSDADAGVPTADPCEETGPTAATELDSDADCCAWARRECDEILSTLGLGPLSCCSQRNKHTHTYTYHTIEVEMSPRSGTTATW